MDKSSTGTLTTSEREALSARIDQLGIEEIARIVGVVVATVARAVLGGRLRQSTRDAIRNALKKQGGSDETEQRCFIVSLSGNPSACDAITTMLHSVAAALGCEVEITI